MKRVIVKDCRRGPIRDRKNGNARKFVAEPADSRWPRAALDISRSSDERITQLANGLPPER
jgi:hypothetical protein